MASPQWRSDPALIDRLFQEPYRFDFFQAVRLLEWIGSGRVAVGHDGPFNHEIVHFAQHLTLQFPASALHSFLSAIEPVRPRADEDSNDSDLVGEPLQLVTSFMGLIGPLSALPTVYTEELIGLKERDRRTAIEFLNLFHHRLVSFFYRSWEKYNLPTLWETNRNKRNRESSADDPLSVHLFDFLGLGSASLRDRQAFADSSLLFYTGIFAQQHRSALMLERLLRDYFGHPTSVLSFAGQWLRLEPEQRSRMGRTGAFNELGKDIVVGRKVWDLQSKFRVRIGPLTFDQFRDFLPGGAACDRLMELVRFYARAEFAFDVQPVLKAEDVPDCQLSGNLSKAAQLGRYSWLKRRAFLDDADQAVFRPNV
jgi:type VI secretion system protein ImpH